MFKQATTILIVGLGNPGTQYENNRHNVGFMAIDAIAQAYAFSPFNKKDNAVVAEGKIGSQKVYLLKPQTFMNLSGRAVQKFAGFYKIPVNHIIVIHDDIDMEMEKIRMKQGGGHGGHNGLKDIDALCGNNYYRLKIGVGHPGAREKVAKHVLEDFTIDEMIGIKLRLDKIVKYLPLLLEEGKDAFSSQVNQGE